MSENINDNLFDIDQDIEAAENRQMRLNQGRRLASLQLRKISDGMGIRPLWNGNQVACVCQAAVSSEQQQALNVALRSISELNGKILGLQFQLDKRDAWYGESGSDANSYQNECLRTASKDNKGGMELALLGLGLTGEAGEVADHIKKNVGHGHILDREKVAKQLGDTLWYLAVLSYHMGYELSDVMDMNVAKLRKRYPNGFSVSDSVKRVDVETGPEQAASIRDFSTSDEMLSRGTSVESTGLADSLVSEMRQGSNVETIGYLDHVSEIPKLADEPTVFSLGPDVWCEDGYDTKEDKPAIVARKEQGRDEAEGRFATYGNYCPPGFDCK